MSVSNDLGKVSVYSWFSARNNHREYTQLSPLFEEMQDAMGRHLARTPSPTNDEAVWAAEVTLARDLDPAEQGGREVKVSGHFELREEMGPALLVRSACGEERSDGVGEHCHFPIWEGRQVSK